MSDEELMSLPERVVDGPRPAPIGTPAKLQELVSALVLALPSLTKEEVMLLQSLLALHNK